MWQGIQSTFVFQYVLQYLYYGQDKNSDSLNPTAHKGSQLKIRYKKTERAVGVTRSQVSFDFKKSSLLICSISKRKKKWI